MGKEWNDLLPILTLSLIVIPRYSVLILSPQVSYLECETENVCQHKMMTPHTGKPLTATHAIYQIRLETVLFPRSGRVAQGPSTCELTLPHIEICVLVTYKDIIVRRPSEWYIQNV